MAVETVTDMVRIARTLTQDTRVGHYRYSDNEFLDALNAAMLEVRRVRPDLLLGYKKAPSYSSVGNDIVAVDEQYRMSLVYYMIGHVHLRDEEDTQDARATVFMNKFVSQMLTIVS